MKRHSATLAKPSPESAVPVPAHQAARSAAKAPEGDSGSVEALLRFQAELVAHQERLLKPMLQAALDDMHADRPLEGAESALRALEIDDKNGWGWYILAVCREKAGAFTEALHCYERASQLLPDNEILPNDLGRLAARMDMPEIAEKLFARYLLHHPDSLEGVNNYACVLRNQSRFEQAVDVLRPYIQAYPDTAMLWNTLGTVLYDQGRMQEALVFFDEALRVDPAFVKARYNRANAHMATGNIRQSLVDCEAALTEVRLPQERAMMRLARSTTLLSAGEVGSGWDAYEVRFDPDWEGVAHILFDAPRWEPGTELAGKRRMVFGEQGLGDDVLFANLLDDVIAALGSEELLTLAVEPRLIPLFQQTYPKARIVRHTTFRVDYHVVTVSKDVEPENFDLWSPLGSFLREFRRTHEAFPRDRASFLKADPERVAHWRAVLDAHAPGKPKVGLLWKSLKMNAERSRYFSPFDAWRSVLATPGVTFVNLQYGDCDAELAAARAELGVEIFNPPLDLKDDLADVAALSCAMDLVIGPSNATTNIAAACGAPLWLLVTPDSWTRLGAPDYPWYPQARVFESHMDGWAATMSRIAGELNDFASAFPGR